MCKALLPGERIDLRCPVIVHDRVPHRCFLYNRSAGAADSSNSRWKSYGIDLSRTTVNVDPDVDAPFVECFHTTIVGVRRIYLVDTDGVHPHVRHALCVDLTLLRITKPVSHLGIRVQIVGDPWRGLLSSSLSRSRGATASCTFDEELVAIGCIEFTSLDRYRRQGGVAISELWQKQARPVYDISQHAGGERTLLGPPRPS